MTEGVLAYDFELWPRQMEAYQSEATEMLFGGATEGGKSHYLRVLLATACLACPGLQCVLVRKKYDDILKNHVHSPNGFKRMLAPGIRDGSVVVTKTGVTFRHTILGPDGKPMSADSMIAFQHCQDERQFDSAQGVEKHILAIDEATQISERLIRFFRTWVRMTPEMKAALPEQWRDKLPCILYTANPIGTSVPYFKRQFVDALPNECIKEVAGFKRQYLLSRYTDNGSVDEKAHAGRLQGIGDEKLAKALDDGDWNAITGEFFPEWDEDRHVVTDFLPPAHWFRFRSFDWGTAEPFAVYWIAVSDGEPFTDGDGVRRWFPRGAFIFYREWYGCDDGHANPDDNHPEKGCRMRNEDIAKGILQRSDYGMEKIATLTDSKPFQDMGGEGIAATFAKNGCILTLADTSRVAGWSMMRSRLIGIEIDSNSPRIPMIFITASCKYARDYVPALPRHPSESKKEDAAEEGEATHANDAIRYACMAHTIIKDKFGLLESKVQKAMKELARRPTVKKLLGNDDTIRAILK